MLLDMWKIFCIFESLQLEVSSVRGLLYCFLHSAILFLFESLIHLHLKLLLISNNLLLVFYYFLSLYFFCPSLLPCCLHFLSFFFIFFLYLYWYALNPFFFFCLSSVKCFLCNYRGAFKNITVCFMLITVTYKNNFTSHYPHFVLLTLYPSGT